VHKKPKLTGPGSLVTTAHVSVLITVYKCSTQYSTGQFWSYL